MSDLNQCHCCLPESIESSDRLFAELDNRVREDARVNVQDQGNIKFSVWVSFGEIYNEQLYDLLEPIPKKKNARRPCLKLSEDKNGSPYIKGIVKFLNFKTSTIFTVNTLRFKL